MDESPVMDLSDPDVAAAVALNPQGDEPDPDALADVPGVVLFRTSRAIFDKVIDMLPPTARRARAGRRSRSSSISLRTATVTPCTPS
eukprot:206174-Prymnesium_polylepis.1